MDDSECSIIVPESYVSPAKYETVTDVRDLISVPLASSTLIMDDYRYRRYIDLPSEKSYLRQSDVSSIGSSGNATLDDVKSEPSTLNERNKSLTFTVDDKPENSWRFKITIPEPFSMSLRDANRRSIKAKLHKQLQQEIDRKKREDEEECCHQFRANPVPPHTYLPVYETMTVQEKLRKMHRRDKSHERVLKVQKPFDFYYREEVKKYFRSSSAPDLSCPPENATTFQAKPIPTYIQRRSRSAGRENRKPADTTFVKVPVTVPLKQPKVFNSNNICPRMKKVQDLETDANWIKNNLRPSLILNPPDFKAIHKKLAKKQAQNQIQVKQTTSCEPFHLLTSNLPHRKKRNENAEEKDYSRSTRWPFTAPRNPVRPVSSSSSHHLYSPSNNPKLNWAAKLRVDKSKNAHNLTQKDHYLPKQDIWRNSVRRTLRTKMSDYESETIEEKLKRRKSEVKAQLLEYQQEISDMITRVERRPLLMELQVEMAARRRAERQFVEKLQKQGLTEEFIIEKCLHAHDGGFAQSNRSVTRSNSSSTPSSKHSRYLRKNSSSEDLSRHSRPESHSASNRLSLESNASQSSTHSASSSEVGEM